MLSPWPLLTRQLRRWHMAQTQAARRSARSMYPRMIRLAMQRRMACCIGSGIKPLYVCSHKNNTACSDLLQLQLQLRSELTPSLFVQVMTGEALKTIVRECWGLGGQLVNGTAAALLHLTYEPGYNLTRRQRINSVGSDIGHPHSAGQRHDGSTGSATNDSANPASHDGSGAGSGSGEGDQPASWFGRLLSTATSLIEAPAQTAPHTSGSNAGDAVGQRRRGKPRGRAAMLEASRMTPRRLPSSRGFGAGAGSDAGTGSARSALVATAEPIASGGGGDSTQVARRHTLGRAGTLLRALSDRLLGLHSLLIPTSKLSFALPKSYSQMLAQQLLSLQQPRKSAPGRDSSRTGLVEDIHMQLLLAIDSATEYTRHVYRVAVSWVPGVGSSPGSARVVSTPVATFPLVRSKALTHVESHSAGLIHGVCGYPVETIPVTTADGYLIHLVRIPRRGSTKCAYFQHGLLDSSSAWVSNGNVFSLGCRAWEAGCDVYLGNFRGTEDRLTPAGHDGRPRHTKLSTRESAFWEYSVDDHVLDVIAFVHAIRKVKRREFQSFHANAQRRRKRSHSGNGAGTGAGAGASASAGDGVGDGAGAGAGTGTTSWLPRLHITGLGHSMGGAVLILYILHCRALGIPHGLDKMVLLSPAGSHVHVPLLPKAIVSGLYHTLHPVTNAPFPMRSSHVQRAGAKLLQDLKRSPATIDFLASVMSTFFGGSSKRFAFQSVHFTDYPLGGSSVKVLRHGVQVMWAKDFLSFDYGASENLRRYGTELPPLYRDYFHLFDLPVHFMAGTRDVLIPPQNIHIYNELINAAAPGTSSVAECVGCHGCRGCVCV